MDKPLTADDYRNLAHGAYTMAATYYHWAAEDDNEERAAHYRKLAEGRGMDGDNYLNQAWYLETSKVKHD